MHVIDVQPLAAIIFISVLQVPADEAVEVKQEPKIDFTYSGQQQLDLGFGPSGRQSEQHAKTLSWARLKKVRS